jgi:glycosidase
MTTFNSIDQIDLRPRLNPYFSIDREWREEFIYFLMVDRFHDDSVRLPIYQSERALGIQAPDNQFYGGKISGIRQNLDYIAGLGCSTIWLSPIFENNKGAYHGYNISNYLDIDPNFGTKQDLIDLVDAAHNYKKNGKSFPIRIVLDVVINHSGDNWAYPFDAEYQYIDDQQFELDHWRKDDRPIPIELRKDYLYHRRGRITKNGWDRYPENQHGDVVSLKDYANDDDAAGSEVIEILIKSHCYWIREADVDGFRVDAVKHMGELACSRFCSNVREYAYSLGKRGFFLFGELAVSNDDIYNRYIGQNTSRQDNNKTVFFGLNSLLDFRLASGIYGDNNNAPLREIIKGRKGPETLFNRIEAQRDRALNRGEIGRYLVTFIDNHDDFWQPEGRFASDANDAQVIAAIGFLLCSLGTPCIYYGTEQGFKGKGGDNNIREAMFDAATTSQNLLNPNCTIYKEISKIAEVIRTTEPLRFGRMYYRQISGNGRDFGLPFGTNYTLAFSRITYGREVLVAYNVSNHGRNDFVIVDASIHKKGDTMKFLYGNLGSVIVQESSDGALYIQLNLNSHQFVILE